MAPSRATQNRTTPSPDLLFIVCLDFLAFFFSGNSLSFLSVFPFFSKDFRGSARVKILAFLVVFPPFFPKRQGKEDQGGRGYVALNIDSDANGGLRDGGLRKSESA